MPLPLRFSTATRLKALAFVATAAVAIVGRSAAFIVIPSAQLLEPAASFFRGGAIAPTKVSSTTTAPKGATEQRLTMGPPLGAGERVVIVGGGIGELVTGQVRIAFVLTREDSADVSCAKLKRGGTFSNNTTTARHRDVPSATHLYFLSLGWNGCIGRVDARDFHCERLC